MKREFLEGLGLEKEVIDKIMTENGNDINKSKADYDEVKTQLDTANNTIKERDKQIESLKKVDAEALQSEITKLQNENKEATKKYQDELKDLKLTNAIKLAITGKVHDEDMATSLFDKSKLVLTDEGKVAGLEEQLNSIKESKAFLFKTDKIETHYDPVAGNGDTTVTKEQFQKMGYTERVALFNENKELYTKLSNE
ncbi:phage scaffolding protein [Clostridium neonatale]|uniref:phage scaffolding protein n=1 Tax=Clostridium neonatale TaxID=137838 RepID=UPI00374E4AF4